MERLRRRIQIDLGRLGCLFVKLREEYHMIICVRTDCEEKQRKLIKKKQMRLKKQ